MSAYCERNTCEREERYNKEESEKRGEKKSREREPGIVQFHGPKLYRWAAEDLNGGLGDIPTSYLTSVLPLVRINNVNGGVRVRLWRTPIRDRFVDVFHTHDDRIFCDLRSEFLRDTEIAR